MDDLTIVYYTDNHLQEPLFSICQERLRAVAHGRPIISVSQKPIDLGDNICLGEIGRSYNSYYRQILAGALAAKTKWVATVEHDCLYTPEHFTYVPSDENIFWYNINVWYKDDKGFSYYCRKAQSMMIAERGMLVDAISEKLLQTETDYPSRGRAKYTCEPGVCDSRPEFIEAKKAWCEKHNKSYREFKSKGFRTELPNIDIRHSSNFSRPGSYKLASGHRDSLPYWGKLDV